ncbi:hypothetical protein AB0N09_42020 [Streptomyces erythrochromogenes]|uniref:hypothetical protein n=1 Tax=Streptomyces erythrochromogenes TaxID=285574 RepID=UPI0034251AE5
MTTRVTHSHTVTARITDNTPAPAVYAASEEGDYEVTVFRTEMITFRLRAASTQDAEERYLTDGEETGSATVSLNVDSTVQLDSAPAPARTDIDSTPAPAMSRDEYQRRTLEELADDVIVCGVAYSRAEWERAEYGVQSTTIDAEEAPAAQRTRLAWDGTDAPF